MRRWGWEFFDCHPPLPCLFPPDLFQPSFSPSAHQSLVPAPGDAPVHFGVLFSSKLSLPVLPLLRLFPLLVNSDSVGRRASPRPLHAFSLESFPRSPSFSLLFTHRADNVLSLPPPLLYRLEQLGAYWSCHGSASRTECSDFSFQRFSVLELTWRRLADVFSVHADHRATPPKSTPLLSSPRRWLSGLFA